MHKLVGIICGCAFTVSAYASSYYNTPTFEENFVPMCTMVAGRATKYNPPDVDSLIDACHCIDKFVQDNEITHDGLKLDLILGTFVRFEYYLLREGLSVEEQFESITDVISECSIE